MHMQHPIFILTHTVRGAQNVFCSIWQRHGLIFFMHWSCCYSCRLFHCDTRRKCLLFIFRRLRRLRCVPSDLRNSHSPCSYCWSRCSCLRLLARLTAQRPPVRALICLHYKISKMGSPTIPLERWIPGTPIPPIACGRVSGAAQSTQGESWLSNSPA